MKKSVVTSFGLLLAIVAASPDCWAQIKFDNGGGDLKFLTAANWDPDGVPDDTIGNLYAINDGLVVAYDTAVSTSVRGLFVGGDAPVTPGVDSATHGRLNISAGDLTVTGGGGEAFEIGRACCTTPDVSVVELTNSAVLTTLTNDPKVGTRAAGQLLIRDTAKVIGGGGNSHWRLGNYGPSSDVSVAFPLGLAGEGLLDVADSGEFTAHVIFLGDRDSIGELRISDNGSVKLTGNLVSRPDGAVFAAGSATVRMSGSTATLEAFNLESESLVGEIRTKYRFDSDGLGVSEINLRDAINITNNDLEVNLLSGFALAPATSVLLFDGDHTGALDTPVGNRIFGSFANLTVSGGASPSNYYVVYDQPNGNILLARTVPEPSTMLLLGLGMSIAFCAKRRASR